MIKDENEVTLLPVHNKRIQDKQKNIWYQDNIANNHMCIDKDKFMELNDAIRGNVTFTNDLNIVIKGKGMIFMKLKYENHQSIW